MAKYDLGTDEWGQVGYLENARHGFGVVEINNFFIVMGGGAKKSTELCQLNDQTIECKSMEPVMDDFRYYPAMMVVPINYTSQCT